MNLVSGPAFGTIYWVKRKAPKLAYTVAMTVGNIPSDRIVAPTSAFFPHPHTAPQVSRHHENARIATANSLLPAVWLGLTCRGGG